MSNLDILINRTNNVLGALEGLIHGDAAETPLVDTSVSYTLPAIAYDETNSAWTLSQTTADTIDGLYKGLFTLALETGCAYLTVVSHNVVTPDDNVPARYLACGGSTLTDVAAVSTLNDKEITKLEIRSKQPFSINIQLAQRWGRVEDFTVSSWGWSPFYEPEWGNRASYSGSAWVAAVNSMRSAQGDYATFLGITKTMPAATYTRIEMDVDITFTPYVPPSTPVWGLQNTGVAIATTGVSGVQTLVWEGSAALGTLAIPYALGYKNNGTLPNGGGSIFEIRYYGTGVLPTGLGAEIE